MADLPAMSSGLVDGTGGADSWRSSRNFRDDSLPWKGTFNEHTAMPHKFTHSDDQRLAGVWLTRNLRRYCAWQFEPGTSTLKASRGVTVHTATLDGETRTLDQLREELPQMALQLTTVSRLAG